ncbi:hypothetical protein OC845_003128 [Tilletia horrida]|nr:hypothetical protein OC845_003128 [Tilletia horrida]
MRIAPSLLVLGLVAGPATSLPVKVIRVDARSNALAASSSSTHSVRDIGDWPAWQTALAIGGGVVAVGGGAFGLRWLIKSFQGARELNTQVFPIRIHEIIHHRAEESLSDEDIVETKLIDV